MRTVRPTDADAASQVWDQVRDQLAATFPKIGPLTDTAKAEVLAFTTFPAVVGQDLVDEPTGADQRRDRTPRPRRRHFPNEASVIRLVGAVLNDLHDQWQVSDRRYLSEGSMAKINPTSDTGLVAAVGAGD
jgi:putative transposase